MKSKRNQILLLLLVSVVWGVVIYRFFSFTDGGTDQVAPIGIRKTAVTDTLDRNEYIYKLNYRDPFLKNSGITTEKAQNEKLDNQENKNIELPTIKYLGMVSSKKQTTGLIILNGKSHMVNQGDKINNNQISVLRLKENEIQLQFVEYDTIVSVAY